MHNNKQSMLEAVRCAPSADNSQPWCLEWQNSTLQVHYDSSRVGDKTFPPDNPATLLSIGAVIENIRQAAEAINCPVSFELSPHLNNDNPLYFKAIFDQSDNAIELDTQDISLFKRHTNRHPYQAKPISDDALRVLKNLTLDSSRVIVHEQKSDITQIAKLVRLASEIRFRTQDVHEWLARSLRFDAISAASGDGLDLETLDLPPGGNLFLKLISDWRRMTFFNKFYAYKALAFIDSAPIKQAPALIAVVGPQKYADFISSGQLMERIWIELNSQGIAVQPYYVIADQLNRRSTNTVPMELKTEADKVYSEAQQVFALNPGETLHMLLRIGYAKHAPVLSQRLPLTAICSGD